jgi:anthranilate synthase component 2
VVEVHRNDEITIDEIEKLNPEFLVISPGPCTPNEAGISIEAIKHFSGKVPMLGVCLGFQAMVQAFGGNVVGAKKIMHGKISAVHHNSRGVFTDLKNPLNATRYHSLVAEQSSLPDCFDITSWTKDEQGNIDEIMGIRHKELAIEGVQFHPESILTEEGHEMLDNFLKGKN